MTKDQAIKMHLVALAEYLQCSLTDAQVIMYAKELEMDLDRLVLAINLLKQDPTVWPGKFPLPGKIKSYLTTDLEDRANQIVINIMRAVSEDVHWTKLPKEEQEVVKVFGWNSLNNIQAGQSQFLITNMRSIAKTIITPKRVPDRLELVMSTEPLSLGGPDVPGTDTDL